MRKVTGSQGEREVLPVQGLHLLVLMEVPVDSVEQRVQESNKIVSYVAA